MDSLVQCNNHERQGPQQSPNRVPKDPRARSPRCPDTCTAPANENDDEFDARLPPPLQDAAVRVAVPTSSSSSDLSSLFFATHLAMPMPTPNKTRNTAWARISKRRKHTKTRLLCMCRAETIRSLPLSSSLIGQDKLTYQRNIRQKLGSCWLSLPTQTQVIPQRCQTHTHRRLAGDSKGAGAKRNVVGRKKHDKK